MSKTLGFCHTKRYMTLYGAIELIDSKVDQSVLMGSDVTFNSLNVTNDVIINGNLEVKGLTTSIDSTIVNIKDNILLINSDELGNGVSAGLSGIEISRGNLTNYQFVFEESSNYFKVGQVNNLQAVATREDTPLTNGIAIYNTTLKRFDAVSNIPINTIFSGNTNSTLSSNGSISIIGGMGISQDIRMDGKLYLKGNSYGNFLSSSNFNELIITTIGNLVMTVPSGFSITVPTNVNMTFGSATQRILSNGSFLTIASGDVINLTPGTNKNIIVPQNSAILFGTTSLNGSVLFDGSNFNITSTGNLNISPIVHLLNTAASSLILEGGLTINNLTDSTSITTGATTIAGGLGVSKKVNIGGITTITDTTDATSITSGSMIVFGGIGVSKTINSRNLTINTSFSSNPDNGKLLYTGGITFIDSISPSSTNINNVSFNSFMKNTLGAVNSNIITTNASTVYIEGAPLDGLNQIITNTYSLWIADGTVRIDSNVYFNSTLSDSINILGGINIYKNIKIGSNINYTPTSTSLFINQISSNINDNITTTSGTATEVILNSLERSTLTASNTNITTTSASTFTIMGAPIAGSNQTISNAYSMWIKQGLTRIDGILNLTNTTESYNSITGALVINGGVGINKSVFIDGVVSITNTSNSISLSSGSLIVEGGVAINKSLFLGHNLTISTNYTGIGTDGLHLLSGNSTFTDTISNSNTTINNVSFNALKISNLYATNTNITTTNASTFYIQGAPVAGINQTITNAYSMWIESGDTRIDGLLKLTNLTNSTSSTTGGLVISGGVGINKNLYVNGICDLQTTSISTNNGNFSISGTNQFNLSVSNSSIIKTTNGSLTLTGDGGGVILNTNQNLIFNVTGTSDSNLYFNKDLLIESSTGDITIDSNAGNIVIDGGGSGSIINIGINNSTPINIGHSNSTTTINSLNTIIYGNLSVLGEKTDIKTTTILIDDNSAVVNNAPSGISDGAILVHRYQTANNSGNGEVINDTPNMSGVFGSGSSGNTLKLDPSSNSNDNYYNDFWIIITNGLGINQVRKIKSYTGTTKVATVYGTGDTINGLDIVTSPNSGDTYNLYNNSFAGIIYSETNKELRTAYTVKDTVSGTITNNNYIPIHCGGLINEGTTVFNGSVNINNSDFYVGNVFSVSNSIPNVIISNPVNTVNSTSTLLFQGKNNSNNDQVYSRITSTISNNIVNNISGLFSLDLYQGSGYENYITLDSNSQNISFNKKIISNDTTTSINSTSASVVLLGGISISNTTDATSISSGGSATLSGGLAVAKKMYIGGILVSDNTTASSSLSSGAVILTGGISISNTTDATSITSGGSATLGGGLAVAKTSYLNNVNVMSTTHSINSNSGAVVLQGGLAISNTTNSSSSTNGGAMTIAGGVAINKDIYIGGNLTITGTITGGYLIVPNNPTITTSNLTNINNITISSATTLKMGNEVILNITFNIDTSTSIIGTYGIFRFNIPLISSNFTNYYGITLNCNGNHGDSVSNLASIENLIGYTISGTTDAAIKMTIGSVNNHIVNIIARYNIV